MQAPAHSRPSAAKSRLSITADPCTLDLVLQTPISTRFNVSAACRVSVCLSFFAYVSLNYVAILYKSLHVSASKYHPVVLSSPPVCSPVPPLALSSSSLISLFRPLLFLITVLSQSARRSRFLDPSCPLGRLTNLPAPLDPS